MWSAVIAACQHNWAALTPDELKKSVLVTPLSKSDWQLRGLFDRNAVLEQLLPAFIGKCLLGLAFLVGAGDRAVEYAPRQRQVNEGRRRYQDIFEGTGVALCVLDLSGLNAFFDKAKIRTREQLHGWLQATPKRVASCSRNCASPRSTRWRCAC